MDSATFAFEQRYAAQGYNPVVGIDEAGRGPLAGPVVAAACTLKHPEKILAQEHLDDALWDFVRDSKKVSVRKREEVFAFIQQQYYSGVGIISVETIDRINILQATFLAMKGALTALKAKTTLSEQTLILIDGNQNIPQISLQQKTVTKGDAKVKAIAAASIIAKVTRDRMMIEYATLFPQYGFDKHKGYGTKMHMDALKKHGATPLHRMSFAPVKKVL